MFVAGQCGRIRATSKPCIQLRRAGRVGRSALRPSLLRHAGRGSYFDTDFLNMRSIFSLICSIACEFC